MDILNINQVGQTLSKRDKRGKDLLKARSGTVHTLEEVETMIANIRERQRLFLQSFGSVDS